MPRFARDADPAGELCEFLKYKLDDAAYLKAESMIKMLIGTSTSEDPPAMDASLAYDHNSTSPGRIVADRERAIADVERVVGRHTVIACDTAASVFRTALARIGVDAKNLHSSALKTMWDTARRNYDSSAPRPAMDARSAAAFARHCPEAARIKVLG